MSFKKMYKRIFCAIYNKIKELLQFIMLKYLKYFTKHEDYTEYINGLNKVLPNVSFCEDNKEIHYLSGKDVFTKFNPTIGLVRFLYIDDFPTDVCENKYGNDMAAFKQDFINYVESNFVTNPMPENLTEYWDKFKGKTDNEKPLFTENGKNILTFLQEHPDSPSAHLFYN